MAHENAEDLTANVLVRRSVRHRSTIGFARHRSYGRTATVDKIVQRWATLPFAACPLGHPVSHCKCLETYSARHVSGRRSTRRPKAQLPPRRTAPADQVHSQNGGHFDLSWAIPTRRTKRCYFFTAAAVLCNLLKSDRVIAWKRHQCWTTSSVELVVSEAQPRIWWVHIGHRGSREFQN